jgi:hypothetical protein
MERPRWVLVLPGLVLVLPGLVLVLVLVPVPEWLP